jgi:hypothetical protein
MSLQTGNLKTALSSLRVDLKEQVGGHACMHAAYHLGALTRCTLTRTCAHTHAHTQEAEVEKLIEVQSWWKSEQQGSETAGEGKADDVDDDDDDDDDGGLADAKRRVVAYRLCESLMVALIRRR